MQTVYRQKSQNSRLETLGTFSDVVPMFAVLSAAFKMGPFELYVRRDDGQVLYWARGGKSIYCGDRKWRTPTLPAKAA